MDKTASESRTTMPFFRRVYDQSLVTPEIQDWPYDGDGTSDNPYIVDWIDNDPINPMNLSTQTKWLLTSVTAISTLAVSFASSAYVGSMNQIMDYFGADDVVVSIGVSLYVLGFGLGPILWAPLSEVYGRQVVMVCTYGAMTLFNVGAIFSQNLQTLFLMRFFAGTFGSAPLTNTGGMIADIFTKERRGLAIVMFATAPFMGPVLGPITGGFVGETVGWRWDMVMIACFSAVCWIFTTILVPETFAPLLLRKRAVKLSRTSGKNYVCHFDLKHGPPTLKEDLKVSLTRPWLLLFHEPIVFVLTIYSAVIYGTLYMLFCAFPFVFEETRGWSEGSNGLAFLGIFIGLVLGMVYNVFDDHRYRHLIVTMGNPSAEARLPPMMVGAIALPVGLFWFAWTNYASVHFLVPITATVFFGVSNVLVFVAIKNYLVDSYIVFAASAIAPTVIIRSLVATAFPLFTPAMFHNLGIHWASSIPAFLSLLCMPFPFIFYRYGPAIRKRCKYSREAQAFLDRNSKEECQLSSQEENGGIFARETVQNSDVEWISGPDERRDIEKGK